MGEDLCTECSRGFFLESNGKQCTAYPNGIVGCMTYSNETTCTYCKADRYLEDNKCPEVTEKIDGCMYYENATTCKHCETNKLLVGNVCSAKEVDFC